MEVDLNDQSDSAEDEDYDPLKDPSAADDDDDEESDSFEGLRHVLENSKKKKNFSKRAIPSDRSPDLISRRTRTRLRLPDELWTEADMELDRAEKALDPLSPSSEKGDLNGNAFTNDEYRRLLAVAWGQAEPEDDEDEDDEDFVPDVEGNDGNLEDPKHPISVSQHELNALLEEESAVAATTELGASSDPTLIDDRPKRKRKRGSRDKATDETEGKSEMDFFSNSLFSREQFLQLQCQMRIYFQLAAQQYVVNCCDTENRKSNAQIIKDLYDGLAEMYRVWEVTTEMGKLQDKAVQHLIEYTIAPSTTSAQSMQIRQNSRFSFFKIPGIHLVPKLLQDVSERCSGESRNDQGSTRNMNAFETAQDILKMFDSHFNPDVKLMVPKAVKEPVEQRGFTNAETSLLLTGLKRYETDWEKIQKWVLPTKTADEIKKWFRKLTRRDEANNEIKEWKLNRTKEFTEQENHLLQKGVQYYGKRFDLISEKVILNRTEGELRKAYEKMCKKASSAAAKADNPVFNQGTTKSKKTRSKPEINAYFQASSPNKRKSARNIGTDDPDILKRGTNVQGNIPMPDQYEHENMSSSEDDDVAQDPVLQRNRSLLSDFQCSNSFAEFPQQLENSNLASLPPFEEHYRTRLSLIGDQSAENSSEAFAIRPGAIDLQGSLTDLVKERGREDGHT